MTAIRQYARRWARDLAIGFRLAVGGSRNLSGSWSRLGVGAVGIGLAVAVLLGAASAGSVMVEREAREQAFREDMQPRPGVQPTQVQWLSTAFGDADIAGKLVRHDGPTSPVPPGVPRQLEPGEMVVSPELRALLDAPGSDLLRERFADFDVIGTIGKAGVVDPGDLSFVAGALDAPASGEDVSPVYGFGMPQEAEPVPFDLLLVIGLGAVVLLVPVLIFVAASARIGGAERDRRLAALRLVGADANQVRRVAAGESLVPGVAGLLVGGGLFLLLRPLAGGIRWWGLSVYADDVVPPLWAVALIALLVPLLSVGVTLVALRRTVIEPLGVVRQGKPSRRRVWWRLATLLLGVALMLVTFAVWGQGDETVIGMMGGSALLVVGVALLLPWAVEAVIRRTRGSTPALQLAARRLQVDSGTASRVISGIVVVLTGAVAILLVMTSVDQGERATRGGSLPPDARPAVQVQTEGDPQRLRAELRTLPGVRSVHQLWQASANRGQSNGEIVPVVVGDCFALQRIAIVPDCRDGGVYVNRGGGTAQPAAGEKLTFDEGRGQPQRWTMPSDAGTARPYPNYTYYSVFMTTDAIPGVDLRQDYGTYLLQAPGLSAGQRSELLELARNAVGLRSLSTVDMSDQSWTTQSAADFEQARTLIYAAAMVVMFLAALSVLVLAVEQVRERRRALSAVSAGGVGFGTLARSLLWQNTIPLCVGVGLAVTGGTLLAYLVMRASNYPLLVDWPVIAGAAGLAAGLVLFVTLLSLPALRSAVAVKNLRTE